MNQATNEKGFLRVVQHAAVLLDMEKHFLDLGWTQKFSPKQIAECCERLDQVSLCRKDHSEAVQKELLQNPFFAAWYKEFVCVSEHKLSHYTKLLDEMLNTCHANQCDITNFSVRHFTDVLKFNEDDSFVQLVYLKNFAPMELPKKQAYAKMFLLL